MVIFLNRYDHHDRLRHGRPLRPRGWGMYAVGIDLTAAWEVVYVALCGLVLVIAAVLSTLLIRLERRPIPLPPHRRHHHPYTPGSEPARCHGIGHPHRSRAFRAFRAAAVYLMHRDAIA